METAVLLAGLVTGLVLGLTGAGGSLIAIPLLVGGLHWAYADAVPVVLLAVGSSAFTGVLLARHQGWVKWRAGMLMAAFGAAATLPGLALARRLPTDTLLGALAVVMLVVAWRMWRQATTRPEESRVVRASIDAPAAGPALIGCTIDPDSGRLRITARCVSLFAATGAVAGLLGGMLGVGGGFVIVPALRARGGIDMHAAVATSLLVIGLTSSAAVTATAIGGHLSLARALPFTAGALAGMAVSRQLAPRVAGPWLQRGFAVLVVLIAAGISAGILHQP